MKRVIVLGNSGSGKSSLAKAYARRWELAHLDLDQVAFKAADPGVREEWERSLEALEAFMRSNPSWVIEGCYADLVGAIAQKADHLVFLNPGISICQENCRNRPWEREKYPSKALQDANLEMLLNWVAQYESRDDVYGLAAHRAVFEAFTGEKREICERLDLSEVQSFGC